MPDPLAECFSQKFFIFGRPFSCDKSIWWPVLHQLTGTNPTSCTSTRRAGVHHQNQTIQQTVHQEKMPHQVLLVLLVKPSQPCQSGPDLLLAHQFHLVVGSILVQARPQLADNGFQLWKKPCHPAFLPGNLADVRMPDHSPGVVHDLFESCKDFSVLLRREANLNFVDDRLHQETGPNPHSIWAKRALLVGQFETEGAPPEKHSHCQSSPLQV